MELAEQSTRAAIPEDLSWASAPDSAIPDPRLTDEQCAFFHREGYLSLPVLTTPDEIQELRAMYDELFYNRAGWQDGNYLDFAGPDDSRPLLPQILMPSVYAPALKKTRLFQNCLNIATQLLGPKAEFVFDHAMTKPARGGVPTPWHQDKAFYTRQTTHETITFWVPLQLVTAASGCLRFIPRSNHGPLLDHRRLNGDPCIHGLEALDVRDVDSVHCPLEAGAATVHHHRTLHGADMNQSDEHRWAYAMGFGVKPCRQTMLREHRWNRSVRTERASRFAASLNQWARFKYELRSKLTRLGFI